MKTEYYTLITGASEGLGKSLSIECASRLQNLLLVALPNSGLPSLKSFIEKNFPVKVCILEIDLTKQGSCLKIFEHTQSSNLKINKLINNAGVGGTCYFNEASAIFYEKLIDLNIKATTLLCRYFIEHLEHNSPSHILNVSSLCNYFYLTKKPVYGSSKSYIYYFSKVLRKELKKEGITVSVLCPGGINTNFSLTISNRESNWIARQSIMNPEDVAQIAINGMLKGREVIIPGFLNKFFLLLDHITPNIIKNLLTDISMKNLNQSNKWTGLLLNPVIENPVNPKNNYANR